MRFETTVSLARFDKRIADAKAALQNAEKLKRIAKAGADVFEAEEKIKVPVLDGDLRDSIHQEVIEESSTRVRIGVVPDAPHAKRIEYGYKGPDSLGRHFHQGPHSYIRATYDTKRGEAREAMIDEGESVIEEALK